MREKNNLKISLTLFFILVAVTSVFWFISKTGAFSPPPGPPGVFTGSPLKTDGTNFAIGTNVQPNSRLTIFGGANTGLRVLDSSSNPLLTVGPFDVFVGNVTGETANAAAQLKATGIRASSTQLGELIAQNAIVYGDLIGQPGSSIYGFSSIEVDTISSTFSADNVSAGVFPVGSFAFDESAQAGVGMSNNSGQLASLHVNGTGYFSGIVGIGLNSASLTGPASLNIASENNYWITGFNKGIRLENNSAIEFGGGTTGSGGILYGIGASSSRLYIFNTNTELNTAASPSFYNLTLGSSGVGVGIGATNPSATLHVSGTLVISGASGFKIATSSDVSGFVLTSDASGNGTWQPAASITGGALNYTPRYGVSGWIGDNFLYNTGAQIGVGTTTVTAGTILEVDDQGYFQFKKFFSGAPTSADCDSPPEQGRLTLDTSSNFLYVCINNSWRSLKLLN